LADFFVEGISPAKCFLAAGCLLTPGYPYSDNV
jgi:hypothetical protein